MGGPERHLMDLRAAVEGEGEGEGEGASWASDPMLHGDHYHHQYHYHYHHYHHPLHCTAAIWLC